MVDEIIMRSIEDYLAGLSGGFTFEGIPYTPNAMLREVKAESDLGLEFYEWYLKNTAEDFGEYLSGLVKEGSNAKLFYGPSLYSMEDLLKEVESRSEVGIHFLGMWSKRQDRLKK